MNPTERQHSAVSLALWLKNSDLAAWLMVLYYFNYRYGTPC